MSVYGTKLAGSDGFENCDLRNSFKSFYALVALLISAEGVVTQLQRPMFAGGVCSGRRIESPLERSIQAGARLRRPSDWPEYENREFVFAPREWAA